MKFVNMTPYWPLLAGLLIGGAIGAALGYFGQCTSGACPLTSTWWRGALYGGFMGVLFALSSSGQRSRHEQDGQNQSENQSLGDSRQVAADPAGKN